MGLNRYVSSFSYNYKTLHIYKSFQLIHLNLSSLKTKTNKQIHVSFEKGSTETGPALSDPSPISSRHPCFSLSSQEALTALQERIYEHHIKGVPASAQECDKPGGENSGSKVSLVSFPSSIPPPRFPFHPTFKAIGSWADSFLFFLSPRKGVEFPTRFFARDFAGNRLEFSV